MQLTEKAKKILAISGSAAICAGLVLAISLQFGKNPVQDMLPKEEDTAAGVVVNPSGTGADAADQKLHIQADTDAATGDTVTDTPVDARPAQTDQTEQAIQPEVTKPAAPSEDAVKDPTTKPDGEKVTTPPAPVAHEEVVQPSEPTPEPAQTEPAPEGQAYFPGFGNVDDSGANQQSMLRICTRTAIKSAAWIKLNSVWRAP